ncbi:hypothetical protein DBR42_04595 [Pelomonas sp. HMWF004]|nr:hypothetical protein DBR42_04595 [Pelomonas sp. HMWF004]
MFKRTTRWLVILATAHVGGCAMPPEARVRSLQSQFDASATEVLLRPGRHSVVGSALLRQQGGGVVTCAGEEVLLFPATDYAAERMEWVFGSKGPRGYSRPKGALYFKPDYPEFHQLMKRSTCDAQGAFVFSKLQPGRYYITTRISWIVAKSLQGGLLMRQLNIAAEDEEPIRVVLSD